MSAAIKVENLSKAYQLGEIGTGTLARDFERWVARVRGKEDPFLRIGEANDRAVKGTSDVVWSLRDINFEIEQGDAVGIIGRNGAGKSTLLKILSKVTSPTSGRISGKGRIASLLEVGTGFHPELTGRENIYLNGAILGMRKKEITRKLEQIIDFSGVERYVDTPVKRYSSGMYVRLAFAVAAHLESEILIVDEVLAVGDAEFQKKCLGKMNDVSKGEGRTVLFVSHNMAAIKTLCPHSILLHNGTVSKTGNTGVVVNHYLNSNEKPMSVNVITDAMRSFSTGEAFFISLAINNSLNSSSDAIPFGSPIAIDIKIDSKKNIEDLILDMKIVSSEGIELSHSQSNFDKRPAYKTGEGHYSFRAIIDNSFQPGNYYLTAGLHHSDGKTIDYLENVLAFEILNVGFENNDYTQNWKHGYFRPTTSWEMTPQ
jgi:lipopolysaccharide transport system ATP-binding protein